MSLIIGTKQDDNITEAGVSAGVNGGPTGLSGDFVFGNKGDDLISTGDGSDLAFGGNGHDTLNGGDGNDALFGHQGDDYLHGGLGTDGLIGGAGDDVFAFGTLIDSRTAGVAVADTGVGPQADIIIDFQQGSDVIDLRVLNQRFLPVGNFDVDFTFLGTDAFDGQVAVRYEIQNGLTIIQMDGSNVASSGGTDQVVDAEIVLVGKYHLTADDFIL